MNWIVMTLAFVALISAWALRAPQPGRFVGAVFAFLCGLILTSFAVRAISEANGLGRTTPFDGFVNHALVAAKADDAPLIIFSGASFSRNAIDEVRLTEALRARGYPHRVVSLSLEAASLMERDAHLTRFLVASPKRPDVVFQEIAEVTDRRPTFIFGNSKFSTRAIDQFDARSAIWSAQGLAGGGCNGAVDCVKESGFLGVHAMLNAANVGLVGQGEFTRDVAPATAFDGPLEPRETIDAAYRQEALASQEAVMPRDGLNWAKSFRNLQRARLTASGVRETAYYFPPVIEPHLRTYAAGLCAGELAAFTCIAPNDAALLASLDGNYWLDKEHLLDPGAEIYTAWLADEIVASGVLGEPVGALK